MFIYEIMNTTTAPPILEQLTALGDETRTRILVLLERSEFTVSELCAALQVPQPTVSRHLKKLAEDGWVAHRAEGRNRHYRLADGPDASSKALWQVVRAGLGTGGVYAVDAERARGVLSERRRRSAEFFAASADRWDLLRTDLFGDRAELLPLFGLLDPAWVVGDLGTGTGGLAGTIAPFVKRVIGVDRSTEMLDAARERLGSVGESARVDFRHGDLERLPIADSELDVAVLSLVLHYVVEPADAVREAHRALRPGGRILIVEMRAHGRGPEYAESMGHVWPGFEPAALATTMKKSGFASVRTALLPANPDADGPLLFIATGMKNEVPHPSATPEAI